MAIIVDPDNLDRQQVIFGTQNQKISIKDVGALVHLSLNDLTDGVTNAGLATFTSATATFVTRGVQPGHILCLFNKVDAGHYVVQTVNSETQLTLATDGTDFTTFTGATGIVFDVRVATGGSVVDGITEQAVYSFAKEEWRTDTRSGALTDDLIKHPFPFEAITREQMEIGGGDSHKNWMWFNETTRKKVRTGGWAKKNATNTTLEQWSGIVTLGSVDADSQVYYQLTNATTTPTNFAFKGVINEAIKVYTDGGPDNRNYLKLFVRKKARTYAQSQISDIGVTQLETIVNRFPLAHSVDPAISAKDAEILGTTPYRNTRTAARVTGSNGSKTISQKTFTSTGATFITLKTQVGDTLRITSGSEQGYYTIASVDSETQITVLNDADFTSWAGTESGLNYTVLTCYVVDPRTDGVIANVSGTTGTLTSATAGLNGGVVTVGDFVVITEAGSNHRGIYKVITVDSATQLTVNTTDKAFTSQSAIDFYVVKPGMYLQYKSDTVIAAPATGNLVFNNANPDTITRTSGSWVSDGVTAGDVIVIANSVSNNGSYTIASVAALTLTLIATDSLVNETVVGGLGANCNVYSPFKRTINSIIYGFRWKLFGNNASLQNTYQFIQHQLRQSTDIDFGPNVSRGDITNSLMSFASPTGTTSDLYIDNLLTSDINNVTWTDASGKTRSEPYVASGSISFNANLQNDGSATYKMFFTNDDAGDNTGRDYGTPTAIVVNDASSVAISGNVSAQASISFTYDYDGNSQRGIASKGTDAPVTLVAIGLSTAQFVRLDGTISRSKANNFALVSSLERNYSNA
jgi:hypothetical protein